MAHEIDFNQILQQYGYQPKFTGRTERGLFDLFEQLTGRRGGAEQIPFDIGLPTTGLYDALTRGIREDFLGTPGGPEGGRIADTRAYFNNLGIPEQAINQERLANRDLNNLLSDQAARINESQKDRLLNVLGLGLNTGGNLFGQQLAQTRFNTGSALQTATQNAQLGEAIRQANQNSLNDLLGGIGSIGGTVLGAYLGGPGGAAFGSQAGSSIGKLLGGGTPTSRSGSGSGYGFGVPSIFGTAGSRGTPQSAKLLGI
jgi:hypothetical protein